jgi:anti-sigma regulatory factor (Ser/Thr protein kinase)
VDTHLIDIPGVPSMVPPARHRLRALLANSPLAEAAVCIADELLSNAIRHSASGQPGGWTRLEITDSKTTVRIAVHDEGPRTRPATDWAAEEAENFGRGLTIVEALSSAWGETKSADGRRCTWAEVTQPH